MDPLFFGMCIVLGLVLYALLVNGWTDAPNAIVTIVSTGVLPIRVAVGMAVTFNIIGGLYGTKVAETISQSIVDANVLTLPMVAAAMISIIGWGTFAGKVGMPVSKSHALLAGLGGAAIAGGFSDTFTWNGWIGLPAECWRSFGVGFQKLIWKGWRLVFIGLFFSSFIGFFLGWLMIHIVNVLTRLAICLLGKKPRHLKLVFDTLQVFSATAMAWTHGINDTQKFVGAFVLVLILGKAHSKGMPFPSWVSPLCALTMGIGTMFGGWKIIRTVGIRMTKLTSREGFAAEATASSMLFGLAVFGVPASTTHSINTSIVGVAAASGPKNVRWEVLGRIVLAWICTFPICGSIAFCAALVAHAVF